MAQATEGTNMRRVAASMISGGRNGTELAVGDIMSKDVVTVSPEDTILSTVKVMSEKNVSCVVAVDHTTLAGILTEKDILKGVAEQNHSFVHFKVSTHMSHPVQVTTGATPVIEAGKIMAQNKIKRLPVVDSDQLAGIVTQTDITRGLISLAPLRAVSKVMQSHVATVQADASVTKAAQMMASKGISCVVAMHRKQVAGILTEKDVLRRVVALRKDPDQTLVSDVMSCPLTTVPVSYSVLSAGRKMDNLRLHRVVVMDGNKVAGIVTQTDIMQAVRNELERLEGERLVMKSELATLVDYILNDLWQLRAFLRGIDGPSYNDSELQTISANTATSDEAHVEEVQAERVL
jgi:CBS domain-containing protein